MLVVRGASSVLLTLGSACQRIFRFQEPVDLADEKVWLDHYELDRTHAERLLPRVGDVAGLDVLEIGSGYGGMLTLLGERGAQAHGIDVEPDRVDFTRGRGLAAQVAPAEQLPFPNASFDLVLSHAVLEHLNDIDEALGEAARVLRPGGRFWAVWGPSWLSFNGPHLVKCLGVPWVHLLFSDATIREALARQKADGRWPASYLDFKRADFDTMGRLTRKKLRRAAVRAGFVIVEENSRSPRRLKNALGQLPGLDELIPGELTVDLVKHQLTNP